MVRPSAIRGLSRSCVQVLITSGPDHPGPLFLMREGHWQPLGQLPRAASVGCQRGVCSAYKTREIKLMIISSEALDKLQLWASHSGQGWPPSVSASMRVRSIADERLPPGDDIAAEEWSSRMVCQLRLFAKAGASTQLPGGTNADRRPVDLIEKLLLYNRAALPRPLPYQAEHRFSSRPRWPMTPAILSDAFGDGR